ncbi:MAG: hypothetical protein U0452_09795 [Anaerolineae bacterium]
MLFFVVLITMMLPIQVLIIPSYLTVLNLGWKNTFMALIVPHMIMPLAYSCFASTISRSRATWTRRLCSMGIPFGVVEDHPPAFETSAGRSGDFRFSVLVE